MSLKAKLGIIFAVLAVVTVGLLAVNYTGRGESGALVAGFNAEFIERPDGYQGLAEAYDFEFARPPRQMDSGLMYKACADGAVDVICGFATDGRIEAYDLKPLEDDLQFFPPYYAAPLVRAETLEEHPELRDILNRLAGLISNERMRELNLRVDREAEPLKAETAALEFLIAEGLVAEDAEKGDGSAGTITIGGKDFTEQNILGEMMAQLIEYNSDFKATRRLYLGGTMVCFIGIISGDLDTYAEYTGTGLVNILKKDVITDPDEAYDFVKGAFAQEYELVWLGPFGFNNTYTLTMRRQHAERLGIKTVSDLASYLHREPVVK